MSGGDKPPQFDYFCGGCGTGLTRAKNGLQCPTCRDPRSALLPPKGEARPQLFVHSDYSPDDVRTFYEIPDAIAEQVRPGPDDARTFAQALADLVTAREQAIADVVEFLRSRDPSASGWGRTMADAVEEQFS